jgi:hypothetical protein
VTRRGRALLLAAGLAFPAGVAAQEPAPAPRPARPDSGAPAARPARADTGRVSTPPVPDSLSPDSFSAVLPPLGPPAGPLPVNGRMVFDKDRLIFSGAQTLGELLLQVPGAFLARAGWYGLPEVVHYAGQGATSVEVVWDGYALDPLGEDSAGLDLERIPLGLFTRVEFEVRPTVIRVFLISDTQPVRRARTETAFSTGDYQTNAYRIRYLNRWRSGLGVGLGVNWFGTNGAPSTQAKGSDLTLWLKATWAPSTRTGVEWEYARYSLNRDSLDGVLPGRRVWRQDAFLRAYAAARNDGMGLRFDGLVGSSSYGDSTSADQPTIAQLAAIASYRAAWWSAEAAARVRDARIPLEFSARGAVMPFRALSLDGYAVRRSLLGGRTSQELGAGAALRPLRWLALRGAVRHRDAVAVPAVLGDTAQRVVDWSAGIGLVSRRLDLDVGVEGHGAYDAPAYGAFAAVIPAGTVAAGRTVTAQLALRPAAYFTVSGWYRQPLGSATTAFEPPHHARAAATFRSKFLPRFRRGALDLLVQFGVEGWSDGVMGRDSGGTAIVLDGHGTVDWLVELRLLSAVLFWSLRNSQVERYEVVPGAPMARANQRYGVRWEFTN